MHVSGIDAATVKALGNRVACFEVVERRSGGFRVVLHMETLRGTPVVETLNAIFPSLRAAERYVLAQFDDMLEPQLAAA